MRVEEELSEAMGAHVADVHASPMMGGAIRRRHRAHKIRFRTAGAALVTAVVAGAVPVYLGLNAGPVPASPAAQPTGDAQAAIAEEVVVPIVTGLNLREAVRKLESAGLRAEVKGFTAGSARGHRVKEQSPAGGLKPEGSTVTLTAVEMPDPAANPEPDPMATSKPGGEPDVSMPQDLGDLGDGREFGGIRVGYLPEGLEWGKWSVKGTFGVSSYSTSWVRKELAPGMYDIQAIVYQGDAAIRTAGRLKGYRRDGARTVDLGDARGCLLRMGEAGRVDDDDASGTPTIIWVERPGLAVELMMSRGYLAKLGEEKAEAELKKVAEGIDAIG